MPLSSSYRMHNYMGEYANDSDCLTFIRANKWDSTGNGSGNPRSGMQYFDTTSNKMKVFNGTAWEESASGGAPNNASYWTSTAEAGLSAEINLGALSSGILKHTVSGGVSTPSIATAGTDYENALTFQYSLTRTTNTINLVGDSATPGNSKYYGTNSGGTKGFYDLPAASAPGGSTGYVQFNNAGAFGADSGFTFDSTNKIIDLAGDNVYSGLRMTVAADTDKFSFLTLRRYRNTIASPNAVQSGDTLGYVDFRGRGATNSFSSGQIYCQADGTFTDSSSPGYIFFRTTPSGSTTPAERLRITSDGKIATGGESAPDVEPGGVTIKSNITDGKNYLTIKNGAVSHGYTSFMESDTIFRINDTTSTSQGGVNLIGLTIANANVPGIFIGGVHSYPRTSDTECGCVNLNGFTSDGGTGVAGIANDANLVSFRNYQTIKAVVKGTGDFITQAGIKVGSYGQAGSAGAFQWTGTSFQGHNGTAWKTFAVPAGADYNLQYYSGGALGATAELNWNSVDKILEVKREGRCGFDAITYSSTASYAPSVNLMRFTGTWASKGAVGNGSLLGSLKFMGAIDDTSTSSAWAFHAYATSSWSNQDTRTSYLMIETRTSATNYFQAMRWVSTGNIAIGTHTNPVERLDLYDGSGNGAIRIGNTSGSNAGTIKYTSNKFYGYNGTTWLDLTATGGTPAGSTGEIQFNNAGAFGADAGLFWDNTGKRLGIGTKSGIVWDGTAATFPLIVYGYDSAPQQNGILSEGTNSPCRFIGARHNGTLSLKTAVADNDILAAFTGAGWDGGTTPTYRAAAQVRIDVNGTVSEDIVPGKIGFFTRNEAGTFAERMRVTSAGNVLIGTTSGLNVVGAVQNFPLVVYGSDSNPQFAGIISEASASTPRFAGYRHNGTLASKAAVASGDVLNTIIGGGWDGGTTPTYVAAAIIQLTVDGTVSEDIIPGRIVFQTKNTSGTFVERMRITSAGGVGIGVTSLDTNYLLQLPNSSTQKAKAYAWDTYACSEVWKTNIVPIPNSLDKINSLRGITFSYNYPEENHPMNGLEGIGITAEELESLGLPNLVTKDNGTYTSINLPGIIPVLVEAIKELKTRLEILENSGG